MEGFRQYLGKTITLGTKKCGPGECFVGTFYTINLAEGLFVFKDGLLSDYSVKLLYACHVFAHRCSGEKQSVRRRRKKSFR